MSQICLDILLIVMSPLILLGMAGKALHGDLPISYTPVPQVEKKVEMPPRPSSEENFKEKENDDRRDETRIVPSGE